MTPAILNLTPTYTASIEIAESQPFTLMQPSDAVGAASLSVEFSAAIRGLKGDTGLSGAVTYVYPAGQAIGGHRMVVLDATGQAIYASSAIASCANRVLGMSINAASIGDPITVQKFGELVEPSWNWQLDKLVYLSVDGQLTQVTPTQPIDKFSLVVGFPISSTSLFINIGFPIILI